MISEVGSALYDQIGVGYSGQRRADPRIAAQIEAALGDARSVVNVGAGVGSYEPTDRDVTAVEINVADLERSVAFFTEVLGFEPIATREVYGSLS